MATETQRELYETAKEYGDMAQRIQDTGVLSPEDAAEIAHGLAFLYGHLAYHLHSRRHARYDLED